MTTKTGITIDDSEFYRITREGMGEPGQSSLKPGDKPGSPLDELKLDAAARAIVVELTKWIETKKIKLQRIALTQRSELIFILQLNAGGISSINSQGEPVYAQHYFVCLKADQSGSINSAGIQFLTDLVPVFHPQVSQYGLVRFLKRPESWQELVSSLFSLIQYIDYSLDKFVLNQAASEWAAGHESFFPIKPGEKSRNTLKN